MSGRAFCFLPLPAEHGTPHGPLELRNRVVRAVRFLLDRFLRDDGESVVGSPLLLLLQYVPLITLSVGRLRVYVWHLRQYVPPTTLYLRLSSTREKTHNLQQTLGN